MAKVKIITPKTKKRVKKSSGAGLPLKERIRQLEAELAREKKSKARLRSRSNVIDEDAVLRKAIRIAKQEMRKKQVRLESKVNKLASDQKSVRLSKLKKRIIAEYQGQIIPELITGDNEVELRDSAAAAHRAWETTVRGVGIEFEDEDGEISDSDEDDDEDEDEDIEDDEDEYDEIQPRVRKFKNQAANRVNTQVSQSRLPIRLPSPVSNNGKHRHSSNALSLRSVRGMSPGDYRERRDQIMDTVRRRVASGGGFTTV